MSKIAIMQPTFLPWLGYFAMINRVDTFVFLDSVQFNKRSWQQRNKIKTAQGAQWISVPVESKGLREQLIKDVIVAPDQRAIAKLVNSIRHSYAKASAFQDHCGQIFEVLETERNLCELNIKIISVLLDTLGIKTKLYRSSEFGFNSHKDALLVDICNHLGFKHYFSAPGSSDYIEELIGLRFTSVAGARAKISL